MPLRVHQPRWESTLSVVGVINHAKPWDAMRGIAANCWADPKEKACEER